MAAALTVTWQLISGRRLDQRALLHELSPDQLIGFWADDHQAPVHSPSLMKGPA